MAKLTVPDNDVIHCTTLTFNNVQFCSLLKSTVRMENCVGLILDGKSTMLLKNGTTIYNTLINKPIYVISTKKISMSIPFNILMFNPVINENIRIEFNLDLTTHVQNPTLLVRKLRNGSYIYANFIKEKLQAAYMPLLQALAVTGLDNIERGFPKIAFNAACDRLNNFGIYVDYHFCKDFVINGVRRTHSYQSATHHHHNAHCEHAAS